MNMTYPTRRQEQDADTAAVWGEVLAGIVCPPYGLFLIVMWLGSKIRL